jgi:hypothetical protein
VGLRAVFVLCLCPRLHLLALVLAPLFALPCQANCVDDRVQSPLHVAVQRGQSKMAALLIEYGTSFELCDSNGITALAMAAFLGHVLICKLLLRHGAVFSRRDRHGFTPLHYAAYNGMCDSGAGHGTPPRSR